MGDEQIRPNPMPPAPAMVPVGQSDHDLVVTLVSEMRQLRTEVRDLKVTDLKDLKSDIKEVRDIVASRVENLENDKVDRKDYETDKSDHEKRIRRLEYGLALAIGGLTVLELALKYLVH